jgi:hypothetical protein
LVDDESTLLWLHQTNSRGKRMGFRVLLSAALTLGSRIVRASPGLAPQTQVLSGHQVRRQSQRAPEGRIWIGAPMKDAREIALSQELPVTKTGFVQKEIKIAPDAADEQPEGRIYIIPVRLEDCDVP